MATIATVSLEGLPKSRLIELLHSLGQKNEENASFISRTVNKWNEEMSPKPNPIQTSKSKRKEEFQMSRYRQRTVAIQLQYDGGSYFGFSSQPGEYDETIEKHLFEALHKLKFIDSRQTCNYTRCGRTDKGVSALGQVVSLSIRSSIPLQLPVEQLPKHPCDSTVSIVGSCVDDSSIDTKSYKETDFCHVLNRVLPDNIRALGWTEVTPEFSARFSASSRTYRYFFVQKNLNIDAMQTAADLLLGKHDFRNFCKMDIVNISNFVREIYDAKINLFVESSYNPTMNVWMLEITGIAFLWHQIRCIMAILLLVGEGNESPDIVSHLLDMEKCPSKPPYPFAEELPLVLHRCNFNQLQIHYQPRTLWALTQHFERVMEKHQIDFARAMNAYEYIKSLSVRQCDIKELVDDLLTKKNRTSRHGKQSNNHNKSNEQTSSSNTTQPVEEVESDEKHSQKRPRANPVTSFDANNKELIGWMDVLASIESQHGVTTFDCNNLHISLRQRKCIDLYAVRVENLGGKKKERHERHVELREDGAAFQKEFFAKMRQQGSFA